MWRGLVLFSAFGIVLCQHASLGQDTEPERNPKQLRVQKYLRLQVTGGRIEVLHRDAGQSRTIAAGTPDSPYRQLLQVQIRVPCVVVHYESVDPAGKFTLHLCEKRELVIEKVSLDPAASPSIRYRQPSGGPVTLTVTETTSRDFVAPTLWHLLLAHRDACSEHLVPLLEMLSPEWRLAEQVGQIEEALFDAAREADVRSDEKHWQTLVGQLSSRDFRVRHAADTQLRQSGQAAGAFLQRLDRSGLSAEQRMRIDRICQTLADGSADTPQRVGLWLIGDRGLWMKLLAHEDAARRAEAAEHLSRLLARPIAFDPAADLKTRQTQLAELTQRYGQR